MRLRGAPARRGTTFAGLVSAIDTRTHNRTRTKSHNEQNFCRCCWREGWITSSVSAELRDYTGKPDCFAGKILLLPLRRLRKRTA
jgi:hypothetical protein